MATATHGTNLPLPGFVNLKNASNPDFHPNQSELFNEAAKWRASHKIKPSESDKTKIHLLLIDVQRDFCFPEGSLYVGGRSGTGAIEDSGRMASFIYKNLGVLTDITVTLDTHFMQQIFFPSFWHDENGKNLQPFTTITSEMIQKGKAVPNPAVARLCNSSYPWLRQQAEFYCEELEKAGKYKLYLWPFHCILGDVGHNLVGLIHEARFFHSAVRGVQCNAEVKGGNPFTENYSVLRPEVLMRHDGKPLVQKNTQFIKTLLASDAVIIAGQAASHCVASSINDLLDEIQAQDPELAKKVHIMTDCMSSVAIPDGKGGFIADFTPEAEKAQDRFAKAGMHLVKSTDPIASWPGIKL